MTEQEFKDFVMGLGGNPLHNIANDPDRRWTATELQNIYNNPEMQKRLSEFQAGLLGTTSGDISVDQAMAVALAKQIASMFGDFTQKGSDLQLNGSSGGSGIEGLVHANGMTTLKLTLANLSLADVESVIKAVKPFIKTAVTSHKIPGKNFPHQYHAFFNPNLTIR